MAAITVASTAGFCFGVRRAIEITEKELQENGNRTASYGPLIHNADVIHSLEEKGLHVINSPEEVLPGESVIIRAHGIGRSVYEQLRERGARIIDATCPFVRKIHRICEKDSALGKKIIILGDRKHPEVQGIMGWCSNEPLVVMTKEELEMSLSDAGENASLVAQTTFNQKIFQNIVVFIAEKEYNVQVYPTICSATADHQKEAVALAGNVDIMIVLGGKHSSNTKKLYDICSDICEHTIYAENYKELEGYLQNHLPLYEEIRSGVFSRIGITAGASTPDNIIQEVVVKMSENEFEAMLNENFKEVHSGDIVKGTVVSVSDNEVILSIGYKSEALMNKDEYSTDSSVNLQDEVHVDDEIEVQVVKVGDSDVLVSRKRLLQNKANAELEEALDNRSILTGTVVETMDNGVVVNYKGNRVFIPGSLLDIRRVNPSDFAGQEINFRVIRVQKKRSRIMGDRRSVLYDERNAKREATLSQITEGARMTGTVKNLTNYCAFIDLGGIDGMLHVSEMSWSPVHNPAQVLKEGDTVNVMIKSYDAESHKISLTAKLPEENPWNDAETKYAVGNIVEGTVVRFATFGAFVELEKGIDGLVHISHISDKFVKAPADVLQLGQTVQAKVIDMNIEKKRISLSIRDIAAAEEAAEEAPAEE